MKEKKEEVYKLLVDLEVIAPEEYRDYVNKYFEAVRGVLTKLKFKIKNINDNFPGGKTKIEIRHWGKSMGAHYVIGEIEREIPEIKEKEEYTFEEEGTFIIEGIVTIELRIEAKDGRKVLLYRSDEEEGKATFFRTIYVTNRELLDILIQLKKLVGGE